MNNNNKWNELSLTEKSDIMRQAVANGITNLNEIRQTYNEYADGGKEDIYDKSAKVDNKTYPARTMLINGKETPVFLADDNRMYAIGDNKKPFEIWSQYSLPEVTVSAKPDSITRDDKNQRLVYNKGSMKNAHGDYYNTRANDYDAHLRSRNDIDKVMMGTLGLGTAPIALTEGIGALTTAGDIASDYAMGTKWGQVINNGLKTVSAATASTPWWPYFDNAINSIFTADGLNNIAHGNVNLDTALELTPLTGPLAKIGESVYKGATKVPKMLSRGYERYMNGDVPNWLRRSSLWHNTTASYRANRLENLNKDLEQQYSDMMTDVATSIKEIPNSLKKEIIVTPNRDNIPNPIHIENMKAQDVIDAYKSMHSSQPFGPSPEKLKVMDIDGKPTAVQDLGTGYNPTEIVTTGKYRIPNFKSDQYVLGDLSIQGGKTSTYSTQFGTTFSDKGVPRTVTGSEPLKQVLLDNYHYVQNELPGFKGFGSSVGVMDNALDHVTHDIDGFMTKEAFEAAKAAHPNEHIDYYIGNDTAAWFIKPDKYGIGDPASYDGPNKIDINIIDVDPKTGLGNDRATELYRQFFPEEYRKSVLNVATKGNSTSRIPIVHSDGTPFTNQELLDRFDPITKTIMDSMEASKPKHIHRMMEYLAGPNPKAVHEAIQKTYNEIAQTHQGHVLPKIKFGNLKENIQALDKIGFTGDTSTIAKDPEKMQNVFDLWYMGDSGMFSRTTSAGDTNEIGGSADKLFRNLTDWNEKYDNTSGGHSAGAFLNGIFGNSESVIGRGVYAVYSPKIPFKEGMTPDELISTVRQYNGYPTEPINKENLAKIVQALRDNGLNEEAEYISNNKSKSITFRDLLKILPNSGINVKNAGKQINVTTGINAIGGNEYSSNRLYAGLIGDFNKEDLGIFGRDSFSGWPSWLSRNKVSTDNNIFDIMRSHTYDRPDYSIAKGATTTYAGFPRITNKQYTLLHDVAKQKILEDPYYLKYYYTFRSNKKPQSLKEMMDIAKTDTDLDNHIENRIGLNKAFNVEDKRSLSIDNYKDFLDQRRTKRLLGKNEFYNDARIAARQRIRKVSYINRKIQESRRKAKNNATLAGILGVPLAGAAYGIKANNGINHLWDSFYATPEGKVFLKKESELLDKYDNANTDEEKDSLDDAFETLDKEEREAFDKYVEKFSVNSTNSHANGGSLKSNEDDLLAPIIKYYEDSSPSLSTEGQNTFAGGGTLLSNIVSNKNLLRYISK